MRQVHLEIMGVEMVLEEVAPDVVATFAKGKDEVLVAVCGERFHDMPERRTVSDSDHPFGDTSAGIGIDDSPAATQEQYIHGCARVRWCRQPRAVRRAISCACRSGWRKKKFVSVVVSSMRENAMSRSPRAVKQRYPSS